jgi:hypothetical protein
MLSERTRTVLQPQCGRYGNCPVRGLYPSMFKAGQSILDGFWAIWMRMGIPDHIQIDNTMSFFGSPTHPRGMGPLIRLCLHNDVEPWLIPMSEVGRQSWTPNLSCCQSFFIEPSFKSGWRQKTESGLFSLPVCNQTRGYTGRYRAH